MAIDSIATGSTAATAVFLDEIVISGGAVRTTLALPTSGAAVTQSGTATSEGGITRSADGRCILVSGYAAAPGTAAIATSSSTTNKRVAAVVFVDGTVDASTASVAFASEPYPLLSPRRTATCAPSLVPRSPRRQQHPHVVVARLHHAVLDRR